MMKPAWETVRNGLKLARFDHDGVHYEPDNAEIGDVIISIIKTMSDGAVDVMFGDVMQLCVYSDFALKKRGDPQRYK